MDILAVYKAGLNHDQGIETDLTRYKDQELRTMIQFANGVLKLFESEINEGLSKSRTEHITIYRIQSGRDLMRKELIRRTIP